jgi:multimeric flavodoxin WrbA
MNQKWIAVIGSPRRGMNTETIVDYIIEGLSGYNIQVEKYILDCSSISTCSGCESCFANGECVIHDEITQVIEQMKLVDGYIFASPSFNYQVTAQMKAVLDRTFCLNDYSKGWKSRLSNKKAIIVGVCKGDSRKMMGFTTEGMKRTLLDLDVDIIDTIECYDTKSQPISNRESYKDEVLKRIRNNQLLL